MSVWHSSEVLFRPQFCLFGVDLQEADATIFELPKNAEDGSPGAGTPSKTCPGVSDGFRVASCKQESRLTIPLGLGMLMG